MIISYANIFIPFILPLILSIAIWWNPNFLTANTLSNLGDTMFPLFPVQYFQTLLSAWMPYELGAPFLYPIYTPFYFLVYALTLFHLPLWIINRLWFVVPTAMVGWSTYYFYRSVFKGKYSVVAGTIAALFSMLPSDFSIVPLWNVSLSGFSIVMGSLVRGMHNPAKRFRYYLLVAIGVICLTPNPRYLYLTILAVALYLLILYYHDKTRYDINSVKFLISTLVFAVLINAFWIFPMIYYYLHGNSALARSFSSPNYGLFVHRDMLMQYRSWSSPLWIIRLMINSSFSGLDYVTQKFIYPFTFIMPVYAFISLFLDKEKRYFPLKVLSVLFLLFAMSMHYGWSSKIYLHLYDHFPGFAMLNSPRSWLGILGILYAIMTGATTQVLLHKIDSLNIARIRAGLKTTIKILLLVTLLILFTTVYGGSTFIGVSPKKNIWGHTIYGNHLPSVAIPEEYFGLRGYLLNHALAGNRILNLPWVQGGYAAYIWLDKYTMPSIVSSVSPIPVLAASQFNSEAVSSAVIFLKENDPAAFGLLRKLGAQYVILHKDYKKVEGVFNPDDYNIFEKNFQDNKYLTKIEDNRYFNLYKVNTEVLPAIYLLPDSDSILRHDFSSDILTPQLLQFTGNNYISLDNPASLNFTDKFTISCWVYILKNTQAAQGVFSKWAGSGDKDDNYAICIEKNKVWFMVNINCRDIIPSAGMIELGKWYHIATVFDQSKHGYICYINGIPIGNAVLPPGSIRSSTTPVLIGAHDGKNPNYFFRGYIGNIQIYGESLNSQMVASLYNSGFSGTPVVKKDLRGWYNTDKDSFEGMLLKDHSSYKNNGELNGEKKFYPVEVASTLSDKAEEAPAEIKVNSAKISETEYKIGPVQKDNFYLVLNQSFDPLWKCFVDNHEIKSHYPTEMGMNKWFLRQVKNKEIRVIFMPQSSIYTGYLISGLFLLFLLIAWIFSRRFRHLICLAVLVGMGIIFSCETAFADNTPERINFFKNAIFSSPAPMIFSAENTGKNNFYFNSQSLTFKRINPTKYLVKIENVTSPFWLVFSQSFHKSWLVYEDRVKTIDSKYPNEVIGTYPEFNVKEVSPDMRFTPQDVKFLFYKPLDVPHCLANGYANVWYIKPEKLESRHNVILTIYFWPQSFFYIGIFISTITFLCSLGYLLRPRRQKR